MKKIHSQPTLSVRTPLRITPAVAPNAETPAQTPSAFVRSGPSLKVAVKIANAAEAASAAPNP